VKADGMHIHLGSQILQVSPFRDAVVRCLALIDLLEKSNIRLTYLDVGGGLGIDYLDATGHADPQMLADALKPILKNRPLRLLLEPGRSLVASSGILMTKVLYTKQNYGKSFVIVDAAMNDFIRPALYDAFHTIIPGKKTRARKRKVDVVGPVCETGDFFAKDRLLQSQRPGDYLAILHAGAYGYSMSSNYNSRTRPAEALVDGDRFAVIRKRESYRDLIRGQ
jgi:diaminopimelate decarboxylase